MKVLSFDIGIKTLSFALLEGTNQENFVVLNIGVWNLGNPKDCLSVLVDELLNRLENAAWKSELNTIDLILIEQQPFINNPRAIFASVRNQVLSHTIQTFYKLKDHPDIRFIHAGHKLKVYKGPPIPTKLKDKYNERKRLSVIHGLYILKKLEDKSAYHQIMCADKQDDMTDALLQGLYIMEQETCPKASQHPKLTEFFGSL